ncbi:MULTISPECIES: hypothetical protein [Rhizobium/Agrobacterium group]|jgi:hypothetical protein|uniref:Uncharacterized protein n=1 Tax=Agrobacterium deltaense Zutra 3/1 TaxID=1183427 RepID=A0A1S7RCR2_9HYPH|nr:MULTISPECIES: hypothetical protein [Rhizobium/Agrobacterium group]MBB4403576.1 hypothetical protein [Agrobacterium radiobacter]MBB5589729.1 hypothetical protein [Agrobacterium radiobacter]MCZ4072026.1 hypothetical protein [Agrobacterium sp. LMR679]NTB94987.1 hypothetical protein [Agrobacterium tumefaciens]NTC44780.1 hypothetical protein [Agrobacterium tumefaciens]
MHASHEYQSSGIFLNEDINIVKAAYENVLSAERDPALCRADVARYVLKMYDRGVVDPLKLQRLATLYFRTKLLVG